MGPIALFDKSFLQCLNVDEAVLFDHFFYPVICPLFFAETLADLAKIGCRSTPEEVVGSLAFKTPEMHGGACAFHLDIGFSSLMGREPPVNGQIPVVGGRPILDNGKPAIVFGKSPESQALEKWQRREFSDVERTYASAWRSPVEGIDLKLLGSASKRFNVDPRDAKNLSDVRKLAEEVIRRLSKAEQIQVAFQALSVQGRDQASVLGRWHEVGNPPLEQFAHYAYRVSLVETFFSLALASGKISSDRPSNRCDISYLHYLPFCDVFISSDRLHRECAALFLRCDQEFCWGPDLKADLASQDTWMKKLSEKERNRGLISLSPSPTPGLIYDMWNRHASGALLKNSGPQHPRSDAGSVALAEKLTQIVGSPTVAMGFDDDINRMSSLSIERSISLKRGSWFQVPSDSVPTQTGGT